MYIIIPLGGQGQRFVQEGYLDPKPLIRVMGVEIIRWLINHIDVSQVKSIIIPYHIKLDQYGFQDWLHKHYPDINFKCIPLTSQTRGACESVKIALDNVMIDMAEPVLVMDGDNFYRTNIVDMFLKSPIKNMVFAFNDTTPNPIFSYIRRDETGKILEIVEKNKISDWACTGAYGFASCQLLYDTACQYLREILPGNVVEYYMSGVVSSLISQMDVYSQIIDRGSYVCLGTPLQVRLFCNSFPCVSALTGGSMLKPLRICFDLDGTLVTFPKICGDYTSVEPIDRNIKMLNYLRRMGNVIIIYTARRMSTHGGNMGRVMTDIGKLTFDTLEKFGIVYDEIYFGKPHADVYIDDLAINAASNLEKQLGFYESKIDTRSFNEMCEPHVGVYKKSSLNGNLRGEIYWYNNIPVSIKDMFPVMFRYDTKGYTWYEMEKLDAVSVSYMYLAGNMGVDLLHHILGSINRVHMSTGIKEDGVNIYWNYVPKMMRRYEEHRDIYGMLNGSGEIYGKLLNYFSGYDRGVCSVVHGDPVFTNIMINQYGKIKLIDMRGELNIYTIWGDGLYDWAKVYQSLLGYDEILLGMPISDLGYKTILLEEFCKYIVHHFGDQTLVDIKWITRLLIFTLIPLHDVSLRPKFYELLKTDHLCI